MLPKDTPIPTRNGPVLTVAQITKFVISSDAKAKIAGLFICAKSMVQLCQTLIDMGWHHPKYPIQCDKSTAVGVANETIIQRKTKTKNMQYHWLRCSEAQGKSWFFWDPGANNIADYITKTTPPFIMKTIGLTMQGNHTLYVHFKGVYIYVKSTQFTLGPTISRIKCPWDQYHFTQIADRPSLVIK